MPVAGTTNFDSLPIELFLEQQLDLFKIEADKITDYVGLLFDEKSTDLYQESFLSRPGLAMANRWDMEGTVGVERLDTGYETTVTQIGWKKSVAYTFKMKKFLRYREVINDLTMSLSKAFKDTRNDYGVGWLMDQLFAVGDKWCTAEGKYLFATDHPLKSGSTASNRTTSALTPTSLSAGVIALMTQVDEQNRRMFTDAPPMELWVYDADVQNAIEIVNAGVQYKSGSANYTTNQFLTDRNISIIPCSYITDNAWILKFAKDKCGLKSRISIPISNKQYERDEDEATIHTAKMAFNVMATDWRGLYGSTGTA